MPTYQGETTEMIRAASPSRSESDLDLYSEEALLNPEVLSLLCETSARRILLSCN